MNWLGLFKGTKTEEELSAGLKAEDPGSRATIMYGLGAWHLLNGRTALARQAFQHALAQPYTLAAVAAQHELASGIK
jgi:hypothetical protein